MEKKWLIGGAVAAGLWYLYQQGVSATPGEADPADTNPDGSAASGTDAGIIDEVQVGLNLVPDYINAWADAITIHEGWAPGSRSFRNNNPGNLEVDGDLGRDSAGYGVFSSYNAGRNALVGDLTAKVRKYGAWTLYQVMARYAPPSENNTEAYAAAVAAHLGVNTSTVVGTISGLWSGRTWTAIAFDAGQTPPTPIVVSDPTLSDSPFGSNVSINDQIASTLTGLDPTDLSNLDLTGDA